MQFVLNWAGEEVEKEILWGMVEVRKKRSACFQVRYG